MINIISPTISSETTLSYNHQSQSLSIVEPNPLDRDKLGANWTQLYPKTNLTNSVADLNASPLSWSIGDPGWHNDGKDYGLIENVSVLKGSHSLKFGFYYNRDDKKQTSTWPMNGNINFNSSNSMPMDTGNGLANMMLGNFNNYNQNNAHVYPYFRFLAYEAYAQDSWKINRRLTLEYGIRWEHMVPTFTYTRSGEAGGEGTWKLYSVDLSKYDATKRPSIDLNTGKLIGNPMTALSPLGLICDPCDGIDRGFSPTKNMFAPRIGFAYDVLGDGKMALRAGFGIFHERLRQNNFNFGAGGSWPNLTSAAQLNGNVANIDMSVTQGAAPPIAPPGKTIWPTDNTMPSIYSWYVGTQKELPSRFSLDVSYAGNHAVHLMNQRQVNAIPAGTFVKYPDLSKSVNYRNDALRPYYGWASLNAVETLAYSSYNAMMVRVSRRFSSDFAMNFNYTWSRVMDLVDNDGDVIINPFDMRQAWAPAGYDQTNVVTFDFIYSFPKVKGGLDKPVLRTILNGWELSGIARSQSGSRSRSPQTEACRAWMRHPVRGCRRRSLCGSEQVPLDQPGCVPASAGWRVRHLPSERAPHARRPQPGRKPGEELRHHRIDEGGLPLRDVQRVQSSADLGHQHWVRRGQPGWSDFHKQQKFRPSHLTQPIPRSSNHPAGPQVQLLIPVLSPIRKSPAALCSGAFLLPP